MSNTTPAPSAQPGQPGQPGQPSFGGGPAPYAPQTPYAAAPVQDHVAYGQVAPVPQGYPQQAGYGQPNAALQAYGHPGPSAAMMPYGAPAPAATLGQVRGTGMVILLSIVTFGIYALVYYFQTHAEMKRHTGDGVGGGLALVLALLVGFVSPFLLSHEVGELYRRRGQHPPVSAVTALWCLLPLIGTLVWLAQTNGALNEYWRSLGAH